MISPLSRVVVSQNRVKFFYKYVSDRILQNQQIRNFTPRRAMLYVPGDNEHRLKKAMTLDVDCIVMDCEDGVAANKKTDARETINKFINHLGTSGESLQSKSRPECSVRLNSVESGLCEDDLTTLLSGDHLPPTLHLPKVESPQHLEWFAGRIRSKVAGKHTFNLIMFIESARAMMDLPKICEAASKMSSSTGSPFLPVALVFGSDDFCADIGATRSEASTELLYARQRLVLVAKAYRLQAVDLVYINYKDLDGLKRQSEEGAQMGFTGKQVIHPSQVPVVQEAFLPSQRTVEWAAGLVKAFEDHQKLGKGAFTYKGSMIDMPLLLQARNVLQLADSVKKR